MRSVSVCWASALLMATSCGGGTSQGSAEGQEAPILEAPLALTGSNAQAVASALWLGHAVSTADEVVPQQVRDVLDDYFPLLGYRPNTRSMEIACRSSGAVDLDGAVADAARPGRSEGDHATAVYRSCVETHSSAIPEFANGTVTVRVTASTAEGRTLSVHLDSLQVGGGEDALFSERGEATVTSNADGSATSLSSDLLTVSGGGAVRILEDYRLSFEPGGTGNVLTFRGTQSGGEIRGSVTFETVTPFHLPANGHPDAGELLITGAAGSTVALRAQADGAHVQLVVNGADPVVTTWDALEE
jgi:hypothetical protein